MINIITFSLTLIFCTFVVNGKLQNVIVIGGGVAGLTAARKLSNDPMNRYSVQVFEAKRDRYGGRIWTKRNLSAKSKDIQADLGATFINSKFKDNPFLELIRRFELNVDRLGRNLFYSSGKKHQGIDLLEATRQAEEIVMQAIDICKRSDYDMSVKEAIDKYLLSLNLESDHLSVEIIKSLPSYNIPDLSAKHYSPTFLDFGYDSFVKYGFAEIIDRIVGGVEADAPLDINLRQIVRQLQVDKNKNMVKVRSRDGSQVAADAVIIAVPLTVLQNNSILFDPPLPEEFYIALNHMKIIRSEKVVFEFDEKFWPEDIGKFYLRADQSENSGIFQSWLNMYPMTDKPYLASTVGNGDLIADMSNDELIQIAKSRLANIFGELKIKSRNVTNILRSDWTKSLYIGSSSVYPIVNSPSELWDIFSEPMCPGLYFSGDYTILDGYGTAHGAYLSGLRAADSIMSGYCQKKAAAEHKKRSENNILMKNETDLQSGQETNISKDEL